MKMLRPGRRLVTAEWGAEAKAKFEITRFAPSFVDHRQTRAALKDFLS
jgi:hypothetical protein